MVSFGRGRPRPSAGVSVAGVASVMSSSYEVFVLPTSYYQAVMTRCRTILQLGVVVREVHIVLAVADQLARVRARRAVQCGADPPSRPATAVDREALTPRHVQSRHPTKRQDSPVVGKAENTRNLAVGDRTVEERMNDVVKTTTRNDAAVPVAAPANGCGESHEPLVLDKLLLLSVPRVGQPRVRVPVPLGDRTDRHAGFPLDSGHEVGDPPRERVAEPHVPFYGTAGGSPIGRPPGRRTPVRLGLPRRRQVMKVTDDVVQKRMSRKGFPLHAKRNS